jgi:tetratricopeptide (TPR) repeat protein
MDNLLEQGIAAYKAGKRDEARKIFIALVKQEPDNERAWGWMYQVSNNDQERIHCMKQALRINPANEKAKQILDSLTEQDFPFELQPKLALSVQVQKNATPPVIQAEKNVASQKEAAPNQQKITPSGVGIVLFICAISCLCLYLYPILFGSGLTCNFGGGDVYFCTAKGNLANDSGKLESEMRKYCNQREKTGCMILTWADGENIPVSMPMTDVQVSTQLAQYNKNVLTGYDCFILFKNGEQAYRSTGCSK